MEITLLGVRGSTFVSNSPVFGGETSCFQVQAKGCAPLYVDAGSGLRTAGLSLPESGRCSIVLTHVHWDHIWGLPFFAPMFKSGWNVDIYTPETEGNIIRTLFDSVHFPIHDGELAATVCLHRIGRGERLHIEGIAVQAFSVPHPGGGLGLRMEADGAVAAFSGDCEIEGYEADMEDLLRGAELAVVDGHYSAAAYVNFKGWGHSARESWLPVARKFGIERLLFSHHNPARTDAQLHEEERCIVELAGEMGLSVALARQGQLCRLGVSQA